MSNNSIYLSFYFILCSLFNTAFAGENVEDTLIEMYGEMNGIDSELSIDSINISADHNESNGIPMPLYANGKMQSKLLVDIDFVDSQGSPVEVPVATLKDNIVFYYKKGGQRWGIAEELCTYGIDEDCWQVTYTENKYEHQLPVNKSIPKSEAQSFNQSSNRSSHLTAWLSTTEVAEYRQVCAIVVFTDGKSFDSCAYPYDENAIYRAVTPKEYSVNDFNPFPAPGSDDLNNALVYQKENVFIFNFYVTPIDTSIRLLDYSWSQYDVYSDKHFLRDNNVYKCGGTSSASAPCIIDGLASYPGVERDQSLTVYSQTGNPSTATFKVNQVARSVTFTKAVSVAVRGSYGNQIDPEQSSHRFYVWDQYGNRAALKISYPRFDQNGQVWNYDEWILANQ
ncbi:hypothetical protein ABDZ30_21305 [Aeromonas veronii]|uniref:hypothetical protein n=1 Tax=Aeromonas veronii TaxID=654 RepID=UPI0031FDE514